MDFSGLFQMETESMVLKGEGDQEYQALRPGSPYHAVTQTRFHHFRKDRENVDLHSSVEFVFISTYLYN